MTTSTRPDDRLREARSRRMLEDTALAAVDGGTLLSLTPDPASEQLFHAVVRRGDGRRLALRLDALLGTVEQQPAPVLSQVA